MFKWDRFQPAAVMVLRESGFGISVAISDETVCLFSEIVYIWVTSDNTPIRIGTSKATARQRLLAYEGHINKSLLGQTSPAPLWEAEKWIRCLQRRGSLTAVVHRPEIIETVAGPVRPYLDIERVMIRAIRDHEALLPRDERELLNRSHR